MDKKKTILAIENDNNKLILQADNGKKWVFPGNLTSDVAIASLVYGTLRYKSDELSCYCNRYKITMTIEILDKN